MIELRHLRYFAAVAEELHFGRAAQKLHIAQPALSRQIQRLEEEIGTRLLERTQRSVALTAAGKAYLARANRILDEVAQAGGEALRVANGEAGALKVSFIHSSTYNLTPAALDLFTTRHPRIHLELQESTVFQQVEALDRGEVDIGLLRPPLESKELEWETILTEDFVLAVPQTHRLAKRRSVPAAALHDEPFILFNRQQSPLFYERITGFCEKAGFSPRIAQRAIQIHTVLGLVGAGLGIAIVPNAALKLFMPRVRFVALEEPIEPVEVALAWRRDNLNPAVRLFRAAVRDAATVMAAERDAARAAFATTPPNG